MAYSLVALDTDRIKSYVFGTDMLREIRGASSILDRLNREVMTETARQLDPEAKVVYANGGSGLFLMAEEKAEEFVRRIQAQYHQETRGGASVTGAIQRLPEESMGSDPWKAELREQLDLLDYKLRRAKECPPIAEALAAHPLLRRCDSCGLGYASGRSPWTEAGREDRRFCPVCLRKREEDIQIKKSIEGEIAKLPGGTSPSGKDAKRAGLWAELIRRLGVDYFQKDGQPITPRRPRDLDTFRAIASASSGRESIREYLGLVYADGNRMGSRIGKCSTLCDIKEFARSIDGAIYSALACAVSKYLRPVYVSGKFLEEEEQEGDENGLQPRHGNSEQGGYLFPFDVLLLGGDDLMLLTTADRALAVALEVARTFYEKTGEQQGTLSVGVVFAPLKYPFGLMHDLVENVLRFAKKQAQVDKWRGANDGDDARINFLVVAGAGTHEFDHLYRTVYCKRLESTEFRATLRPYRLDELKNLLQAIRDAKQRGFPRSKLHQLREAVLKTNRTSTVLEALAALQGCRDEEREFLLTWLYQFSQRYLLRESQVMESAGPLQGFPSVIFPWTRLQVQDQGQSERTIYLTPLLDLVELYDFVAPEEDERESAD